MLSSILKKLKFPRKGKRACPKKKTKFFKGEDTISTYRKRKNINFLKRKGNKKIKNKTLVIYGLLTFVFLSVLLIFLLAGPTFSIKTIEIKKRDDIIDINISYKSVNDLRGESIFRLDKKLVEQKLKNYQANIEVIDVNIVLPNTLKIEIGSSSALFNTNIKDENYFITANGVLVPHKKSNELKSIIIKNMLKSDIGFFDYKQTLDAGNIKNIGKIINKLGSNIISLKIEGIYYFEIENEVHVEINNSTKLIFDLSESIDSQIEALAVFNKEHKDISKVGIVYIDLRISEKIFYCDLEAEYQCKLNLKNIYGY